MALQTLNTIKQWFRTGLKPTQAQFWDTWDSFRHKFDKIPVKEVEGLDELLLSKADKTVLDHHLADKNAHAPQVNTDWNSESGFSQLLNKPEFKTINGESLTGDGDIIIEAGASQDLQTTLANGNETTNGIMFNDDYYNWLKTSIDSRSIRLTDSNSDMLVAIDSAGVVTRDDSQHVSLNPQGIFFNRDTAESYLRINTSSTGVSTVNLPATEGAEITLTATDDFKTINGESIIGEGNLDIEPQGLKSVLDADPTASYGQSKATVMGDYGTSKYNELIVSDEIEKTGIYQLKNQLSFDHTALDSNDIGNITLSEGNIKLTRDKSNNQTVVDIADPVANTQLRFPAKSEEGKTYTIATTEDFKTINGESIVGSGDIAVSGGNGDIPTLQEVLDKDRNATNASINLLSEEGESQTTVHEGGLNISEKTETGFLITDINKLGISVSKDEETTFVNVLADELSLNKNLLGNPVKQGIVLNEDSSGASTLKLPLTSDGDVKTLATTEDFKTINGESIVGEGNIAIGGGGSQDLQSVLTQGAMSVETIYLFNGNKVISYNGESISGFIDGIGTNSLKINDRTASGSAEYSFNPEKEAGSHILATLDDLIPYALDSRVVHLNGNEVINDLKTFSSRVNIKDGLELTGSSTPNNYINSYIGRQFATGHIFFNTAGRFPVAFNTNLLNTALRTLTVPDKDGTIALLSDISSGGSQNLQQVLAEGNEAVNRSILIKDNLGEFGTTMELSTQGVQQISAGDTDNSMLTSSYLDLKTDNSEDRVFITKRNITSSGKNSENINVQTQIDKEGIYFSDNFGNTSLRKDKSGDLNTTRNLLLPSKSGTLATTDDLTLQQVLDTGKTAIGKSIELTNTDFGTEHYLTLDGYECTMANLATNKYINFNNSGYYSRDYDTGEIASLSHNAGISIAGVDSGGQTISTKMVKNGIEFRNPNVVTFLKILNQSTGGGSVFNLTMPSKDGMLATTSDFKTINGESIVGEGDITVTGEIPNLSQVLDQGSFASNRSIAMRNSDSNSDSTFNGDGVVTVRDGKQASLTSNVLFFSDNTIGKSVTITPNFDDWEQNVSLQFRLPYKSIAGNYTISTTDDIKLKSYTVSTLPAGTIGDRAFVTDATTPTYLGGLTGGGSVVCPVFYNGTTWVSH